MGLPLTQTELVLDYLGKIAAASPKTISQATGVPYDSVNASLSTLKKRGLVERTNPDEKSAIYALKVELAGVDDPTMIPGGPLPACELAADIEDEGAFSAADFVEPDEETPTAHAVALAVVAAARSLGEDPSQIGVAGAWLRCRFAAVKALAVYYDGCSWEQLGRFVGFVKLTQKAVDGAMNFPWWEDAGDPAFEAAVSALEGA